MKAAPLSPERLVCAWLAARAAVWTGLLYFTQPTLPLDVLEHLAWGREWRIAYAHHPGLPAWINEALNLATGGSRLALSAAAPIATSAAMAAVWLLARRLADDRRAAIAALSLEGAWYFNVAATEFNHNVLQLAACAWLFFLAHRAFVGGPQKTSPLVWTALGATAALSLYAKYSSALFLLPALAWSVYDPRARPQWRTAGPWLALAVFAALTAPQAAALIDLRFAPLQFALERAGEARQWTSHIVHPLRFGAAQLGAAAPALLLIFLARGKTGGGPSRAPDANRMFVWTAAFGPLALALALSALGGWRFKSMWGAAMISFIPLWALAQTLPHPRGLNWRRWQIGAASAAALAALIAAGINVGGPHWSGRGKRIHYPAEEIADYAESQWRARHPQFPLRFAAGGMHIASLVSFYAPSRPSAILDGDWEDSFWATPQDFAAAGGVIVWTINDGKRTDIPPPDFAADYPDAERVPDFSAKWKTGADIPPVKIGVMLVAPESEAGTNRP